MRSLTILFILICFINCESVIQRNESLDVYMKDFLNNSFNKDNDAYLIFNQESCSYCLKKTIAVLNNIDNIKDSKSKKLHIVVAGYTKKGIDLFLGAQILENFDVIYDTKRKLLEQEFFKEDDFVFIVYRNNIIKEKVVYNYNQNIDLFEINIIDFLNN